MDDDLVDWPAGLSFRLGPVPEANDHLRKLAGPFDRLCELLRQPRDLDRLVEVRGPHLVRASRQQNPLQRLAASEPGGRLVAGGAEDSQQRRALREVAVLAAGPCPYRTSGSRAGRRETSARQAEAIATHPIARPAAIRRNPGRQLAPEAFVCHLDPVPFSDQVGHDGTIFAFDQLDPCVPSLSVSNEPIGELTGDASVLERRTGYFAVAE